MRTAPIFRFFARIQALSQKMTISNRVPLGEQLILDMEENPFAEYMWMENEEEFDQQVEFELWEQDFIESCFNQMLEEEEQWEWFIPSRDLPLLHSAPCPLSEHQHSLSLTDACSQTELSLSSTDILLQSSLNPNAKEFTPGIQSHVM